jgi:ATP synthase protein I
MKKPIKGKDSDKKEDGNLRGLIFLSTMGMSMGISIVFGLAAGYYIDKYLGTKPWFMLLFLIFGIVAGFKNLYKSVKKYGIKDD